MRCGAECIAFSDRVRPLIAPGVQLQEVLIDVRQRHILGGSRGAQVPDEPQDLSLPAGRNRLQARKHRLVSKLAVKVQSARDQAKAMRQELMQASHRQPKTHEVVHAVGVPAIWAVQGHAVVVLRVWALVSN